MRRHPRALLSSVAVSVKEPMVALRGTSLAFLLTLTVVGGAFVTTVGDVDTTFGGETTFCGVVTTTLVGGAVDGPGSVPAVVGPGAWVVGGAGIVVGAAVVVGLVEPPLGTPEKLSVPVLQVDW